VLDDLRHGVGRQAALAGLLRQRPQLLELGAVKVVHLGLERLRALAEKTGEGGLPPEAVAKVVDHALTASRPKARYVVGAEAKATAALRTYLPKRVFDRIVERRIESA
jgi:hypothetical protein